MIVLLGPWMDTYTLTKALKRAQNVRCDLCRSFTLSSIAGGNTFLHHESIEVLRASVVNGCDLCNLFWFSIGNNMKGEVLEAALKRTDQRITIEANMLNMRNMKELGGFSAFDELWITSGEESSLNDQGVWGQVEIFTSRRSSLAKHFLGREITTDPSSPENYHDIKTWLATCSKHTKCGRASDRPFPKRILQVGSLGSDTVKLKVKEGQSGSYVALSYCWGKSAGVVTTADNIDEHLKGISLADLPATLADAICITRELGFQYLWIDGLCIIQARYARDPVAFADWQDQASKMADVYGNAFLTIAVSGAADKQIGCFTPRSPIEHTCEVPLNETVDSPIIAIRAFQPPRKSLLDDRAWCFQEGVLSQRVLLYGKDELSYSCRTGQQTERLDRGRIVPQKISGPRIFSIAPKHDKERYVTIESWYGNTSQRVNRWAKVEVENNCPVEILDVQTFPVGQDPLGQVSGGFLKLKALFRDVVVVSKSVNHFRQDIGFKADGTKWYSKNSPRGNRHLLVDANEVDKSDLMAVGALGHFDTADMAEETASLICLFIWLKEGLMLVPAMAEDGLECFKRVGIFTVEREDWLKGAISRTVTII